MATSNQHASKAFKDKITNPDHRLNIERITEQFITTPIEALKR